MPPTPTPQDFTHTADTDPPLTAADVDRIRLDNLDVAAARLSELFRRRRRLQVWIHILRRAALILEREERQRPYRPYNRRRKPDVE